VRSIGHRPGPLGQPNLPPFSAAYCLLPNDAPGKRWPALRQRRLTRGQCRPSYASRHGPKSQPARIMHRSPDGEKKPGFLRHPCPKSLRFSRNQPSEAGLLALGTYSSMIRAGTPPGLSPWTETSSRSVTTAVQEKPPFPPFPRCRSRVRDGGANSAGCRFVGFIDIRGRPN